LTFTENDVPATGISVGGVAVDGNGQVTLSTFPASDLQIAGGATIPLAIQVASAGTYELLVELLDTNGETFGAGSTPVLVGYEPFTVATPSGYDTAFGAGIRRMTSLAVTLGGRYPDTDDNGDPVEGQWRATVTESGSGDPVEGVEFRFFGGSGDPADHETWTNGGLTDATGQIALDVASL